MRRAALIIALTLPAAPVAAGPPELGLPIDCVLGETCFIQNQVDRDPGPGARDYRCGGLTYDGHKGTDIRVPLLADMRRGVNVLAAAPGIVRGQRDGVPDVGSTDATKGKECGNGVVLRHDDGWETQYCHMKSGSVQVQEGQRVERGDVIGQVGLSGKTEFPHVHLSVRQNGKVIDPFDLAGFPACGEGNGDLWQDAPEYIPGGLLSAGFSSGIPSYDEVKDGSASTSELADEAPGLVIYGFGFGGQKGDTVEFRITGPKGNFLSQTVELEKDQAQFFRATGRRLTKDRWPAGLYQGTVRLLRGSTILGEHQVQMEIK
jgi:hypothetical protein